MKIESTKARTALRLGGGFDGSIGRNSGSTFLLFVHMAYHDQ